MVLKFVLSPVRYLPPGLGTLRPLNQVTLMNLPLLVKAYSWSFPSYCDRFSRIATSSKATAIALSAVSSTLLISSATATLAAPYKTLSNQVVVTGLQPKTKYPVQSTNFSDRNSTRSVTTNACGEALISNGTGYRRLVINQQTITPSSLPTQTHQRCNPKRNNRVIPTQQQLNR